MVSARMSRLPDARNASARHSSQKVNPHDEVNLWSGVDAVGRNRLRVAPLENAESSPGAVSDTTVTAKKGSSDGAAPAKGASCDPGPVLPKTDADVKDRIPRGTPKRTPKRIRNSDSKSDPKADPELRSQMGSQIGSQSGSQMDPKGITQSGSQIGPVRLRAGGHRSRYE